MLKRTFVFLVLKGGLRGEIGGATEGREQGEESRDPSQ